MRILRGLFALASIWHALGCAADPHCADADHDGFGPRCAMGPDCDDDDATRNRDCTLPPVDCNETPFAAGCPCLIGTSEACFAGAPENAGKGICTIGMQSCSQGVWSACFGSVLPTFETCNGVDDDCDGVIDDAVLSPCGGCNDRCVGGVWGEAEAPFEGNDVLAVTDYGELTLARGDSAADTLWITNTGDDTVSRIDVTRAVEVARYDTAGSEPARVAIDHLGDVWIANRALGGQASVTKIASSTSRCVDRDGNGIDTSVAGDDVRARGADECVLLNVPVGDNAAVARAIAVDGYIGLDDAGERVWIGLQNEERVVVLDGNTGAHLQTIETPGFAPFDAAFDPWGTLWLIQRDGRIGKLQGWSEPTFRTIEVPEDCWQLDAMAIDPSGRITLSGFYCDHVLLFDPRSERFDVLRGVESTRGVAVNATHGYVAQTHGLLVDITRDPLRVVDTFALDGEGYEPIETTGVALDGLGMLWAISTLGGLAENGVATQLDPMTGVVVAQVPVGHLPYAAGDLTGVTRHAVVASQGAASHVFTGCGTSFATEWSRLHIAWTPSVDSRLGVRARHASNVAALDAEDFRDLGLASEVGEPIELPFDDGGVVEVELTLHAGSRLSAPRVSRVGVEWSCGALE